MKCKSPVRRSPRRSASSYLLDQLESRVLLSGNVTASVVNGVLTLKGDNHNDSIIIAPDTNAPFSVASGDGTTTINGQSSTQDFSNVTGIAMTIGSGNDTVLIQNVNVTNNVQITGGNGNQIITLDNVGIGSPSNPGTGGNFTLTNSGGQNSTTVEDSSIMGSVTVNVGVGFNSQCGSFWGCSNFSNANETFNLWGSTVGNNVTISNTSGETTTDIDVSPTSGASSTIGNNLTVTNGANSYGNCGFHCGGCGSNSSSSAGDLFTLNNSTVGTAGLANGGNVTISNASDGNTTVIEGGSTIDGNLAVSNVVGTSNQCGFNASCSQNLANASDSFTLSDFSSVGVLLTDGMVSGGNVTLTNISDGASASIEDGAFIAGGVTIKNGVGSYGQGFTSGCGQVSATLGDFFTLSGSFVGTDISISNGSTYNCTTIVPDPISLEPFFVGGNLTVTDGLNSAGQNGNNSCGDNSCGNNSCGNNSCGNNSCGGGSSSVYTTDLFTLNGGFIAGSLSVSNASGYTNSSIADGAFIGGSATFINANGVAYFEMDSSFIGTDLAFTAGTGTTNVTITNSTIGTYATFTAGRGTATVSISTTKAGGVAVSVSINSTVRNQLSITV